jgi:hypothetical protein
MVEWFVGNEKGIEEFVTYSEVQSLCLPVDTTYNK